MNTPKTLHYPCCFTFESNPGPLAGIFCATGFFLFHFSGIKMEHFSQYVDCQCVEVYVKPVGAQNDGKFCSQSLNMGTKQWVWEQKQWVWEQFIPLLPNCRMGYFSN